VTTSQGQHGAELATADEQLLRELTERARAGGLQLTGEGGLLGKLTKMVVEGALEGELDDHLGYEKNDPAGRARRTSRFEGLRARPIGGSARGCHRPGRPRSAIGATCRSAHASVRGGMALRRRLAAGSSESDTAGVCSLSRCTSSRTNRNNTEPRANVTDPDVRVMRNQKGYVAGYNGQLVVTAHQVIVGAMLSQHPVDRSTAPCSIPSWTPADSS
jgi:hypothetical protein